MRNPELERQRDDLIGQPVAGLIAPVLMLIGHRALTEERPNAAEQVRRDDGRRGAVIVRGNRSRNAGGWDVIRICQRRAVRKLLEIVKENDAGAAGDGGEQTKHKSERTRNLHGETLLL